MRKDIVEACPDYDPRDGPEDVVCNLVDIIWTIFDKRPFRPAQNINGNMKKRIIAHYQRKPQRKALLKGAVREP